MRLTDRDNICRAKLTVEANSDELNNVINDLVISLNRRVIYLNFPA